MDINIEVRKKQLQSLDQYITSSKDKVQSILTYLGWTAKRVLETKPDITCSVNPRHKIPSRCMESHLKKCSIKTAGYNIDEIFLSEPLQNSTSSIRLDKEKKIEILGQARYNNPKFKAETYLFSTDRSLLKLLYAIKLLAEHLYNQNVGTYIAIDDAAVKIVATAVRKSQENKQVVVVGQDVDLLVLLIALTPEGTDIIFQKEAQAWNGQDPDPMTSDRLFSTFSPDERLTLYEYCVKNTVHPPTPNEFDINFDNKKEEKLLTQEDLLIKERDAKRRRTKYRTVHTSRSKSYTEVVKEVIENQMELYKEYLADKKESDVCPSNSNENYDQSVQAENINNKVVQPKKELDDVERPHSSTSRYSTYSGSSQSKSNYEYKKEYRRSDDEYKRSSKEFERKRSYGSSYDRDKEKRRRPKDHREDYRSRSRDRRERRYKSDRRH